MNFKLRILMFGLVIAGLATCVMSFFQSEAREEKVAVFELRRIYFALESYNLRYESYPDDLGQLQGFFTLATCSNVFSSGVLVVRIGSYDFSYVPGLREDGKIKSFDLSARSGPGILPRLKSFVVSDGGTIYRDSGTLNGRVDSRDRLFND